MIPDPAQNHRILVIDDNQAIHQDFRKIFNAGYANHTALAEAEARTPSILELRLGANAHRTG